MRPSQASCRSGIPHQGRYSSGDMMRASPAISIAAMILAAGLMVRYPVRAAAAPDLALPKLAVPDLQLMAHDLRQDRAAIADAALTISDLDVKVDIAGHQAQTTLVITFANPSGTQLEGDFSLDLPVGATVTGYGLDIDGVMTDGVLQPRLQATEAYEENLRHGVDPGLATVDAGNRFTSHVFPIRARSGRTIKIVYVTPLGMDGRFIMPLRTPGPVDDVHIQVTTHDIAHRPDIDLSGALAKGERADVTEAKGSFTYQVAAEDRALTGSLVISGLSSTGPVTVTRHADGEDFFELVVPAEPDGLFRTDSVRLYWDASRSRRDQDVAAEADLVADYIAKTTPKTLDIVIFADGAPRIVHFETPTPAAVRYALASITYGGATRFDGLDSVLPGRADICLVVSDGNADIGRFGVVHWPCRVMTVSSAKAARRDLLGELAARNRGAYVDLGTLGHDKALTQLLVRAPKLWDITDAKGASLDYRVWPLGDDQYRVIGPRAAVLNLDYNGEDQAYDTQGLQASDNDGAGTMWGRAVMDRFTASDAPDADKVLTLAQRYHVATPDISFIVLESGAAYARAGIAPPATAPKSVRDDYTIMRESLDRDAANARAGRLADVEAMWSAQKTWWNTPAVSLKDATRLYHRRKGDGPADTAMAGAAMTPVYEAPVDAPPPPPPVEAAPAAPVMGGYSNSDTSTVVVTGVRSGGNSQAKASDDSIGSLSGGVPPDDTIEVTAAEWNPDRPYLKALAGVKDGDQAAFAAVFADQEKQSGDTAAFYFDVAEWMFRHGLAAGAAGMARTALDLPGSDIDSRIILADRLLRYGAYGDAIALDEQVLRLTPEKPQATRNLALALITTADAELAAGTMNKTAAIATYRRALGLLSQVVLTPWHEDYAGIEVISLMEANHLVARLKSLGVAAGDLGTVLPPDLTDLLDVDIRITLEWNTDKTDMDLWVDEPSGERAIYSNPKTFLGGRLSNDMTRGYGPEEYLLHHAPAGTYAVLANVYAADVINRNGASSITVHLYRDWGRPTEKVETFVIELKKDDKGAVNVGSFVRK